MELCEGLNSTLDRLTLNADSATTAAHDSHANSETGASAADTASALAMLDAKQAAVADLRFLRTRVLRLRLALASRMAADQLPALAAEALACVHEAPHDYHVVTAAAAIAHTTKAQRPDFRLRTDALEAMLPALQPNLSAPSQRLRGATLALLCCYDPPFAPLPTPAEGEPDGPPAPAAPSDVLQLLQRVEGRPSTVENGRQSAVDIARLGASLQYGRVPASLVGPVTGGLLGLLHIRFSVLWKPASEALAKALEHRTAVAWPLVLAALTDTQAEFLRGRWQRKTIAAADGTQADTLISRYREQLRSGEAAAAGGSTDPAVRLDHLLQALDGVPPTVVESRSRDWVPLLLSFCAAKGANCAAGRSGADVDEDDAADGEEAALAERRASGADASTSEPSANLQVGGKAWRQELRAWLALLGGLKGAKGLHRWREVQRAVALQLTDVEPAVQQAALKSLKVRLSTANCIETEVICASPTISTRRSAPDN